MAGKERGLEQGTRVPGDLCVNKVNRAGPEGELEGSVHLYKSIHVFSRNRNYGIFSFVLFLGFNLFLIIAASCRVPHLRRQLKRRTDQLSFAWLWVVLTLATASRHHITACLCQKHWSTGTWTDVLHYVLCLSSPLLSSSPRKKKSTQRSSGQAAVTSVSPSPPRCMPSQLSRIGLSIHSHCLSVFIEFC